MTMKCMHWERLILIDKYPDKRTPLNVIIVIIVTDIYVQLLYCAFMNFQGH